MWNPLKAIAGEAIEKLAAHHPIFRELKSGRIAIPDTVVKEQLVKQMQERPEIEELDFNSYDGYAQLYLKTLKSGARHQLVIRIEVEEFLMTQAVQRAVLKFPDNLELQSENVMGWFTRGLAGSVVNKMAQSEAQAEEIAAKSNGLVEMKWPRAILHLGRHPQLKKYLTTGLGPLPSVLDIFEIRACKFEPGQIVLPVNRVGQVSTAQANIVSGPERRPLA